MANVIESKVPAASARIAAANAAEDHVPEKALSVSSQVISVHSSSNSELVRAQLIIKKKKELLRSNNEIIRLDIEELEIEAKLSQSAGASNRSQEQ